MTLPEWWIALFRCRRGHMWFLVLEKSPGGRNVSAVCSPCVTRDRREHGLFNFDIAASIVTAPLRHWRGVEAQP